MPSKFQTQASPVGQAKLLATIVNRTSMGGKALLQFFNNTYVVKEFSINQYLKEKSQNSNESPPKTKGHTQCSIYVSFSHYWIQRRI